MSNYIRFFNNSYKYVFLTVVTNNRNPILIENINLLRSAFKYVLSKYDFEIFASVILKDHLHIILKMENTQYYPEIIRLMKFYFSTHLDYQNKSEISKVKKREKGIWQRRYWEHTIRDDNDLNRHLDYIHYNSFKHYNIPPIKWEYCSFKKFVKSGFYESNWCNSEDKYNINMLDFE